MLEEFLRILTRGDMAVENIENYETDLWPLIYDKYNSHGREKLETEGYYNYFKSSKSLILEPACGTGLIFLEMLKRGVDIYGFDISEKMLCELKRKAVKAAININNRVSNKDLKDFKYDLKFDYIYITARSFLHLLTPEDQIACLKQIYIHLSHNRTWYFYLQFFS